MNNSVYLYPMPHLRILPGLVVAAFALLFPGRGTAQDTLSGVVYDASNNLPLQGAFVRSGHRNVATGLDGKFTLPLTEGEELKVGHPRFHLLHVPPRRVKNRGHIRLFLTPDLSNVSSNSSPEAVLTPEFEYVFDYAFDEENLLILSYMNQGPRTDPELDPFVHCALTVYRFGEQTQRTVLPDYTQDIRVDPLGRLWISTADTCLRMTHGDGGYELEGTSCHFYWSEVFPLTGAIDTVLFSELGFTSLPQVGHYMRFPHGERPYPVRFVRNARYFDRVDDDFTMLSRGQQREAAALEAETGINRKLYAPFLRRDQQAIDLERPYAPAFVTDGQLLIFDPMNQWLFWHDALGNPVDSTEAYYQLGKEKLTSFVQDPVSDKIYAVHDRGGSKVLREANTQTGALGSPHKISFPFPDNIQVYEGYVYYIRHIVKEESNKHLYREKLTSDWYAPLK